MVQEHSSCKHGKGYQASFDVLPDLWRVQGESQVGKQAKSVLGGRAFFVYPLVDCQWSCTRGRCTCFGTAWVAFCQMRWWWGLSLHQVSLIQSLAITDWINAMNIMNVVSKSHLCLPPPCPGVHIQVGILLLCWICKMALQTKQKVWRKFRIPKQQLDAFNDVMDIYIKGFTSNNDLLAPKLGLCMGDLLINNLIERAWIGIRKTKMACELNLKLWVHRD